MLGQGLTTASFLIALAAGAAAQQTVLNPFDGAPSDSFGGAVARVGDSALIAAWNDDEFGSDSGSVYAFRRSATGSWNQLQKLYASNAQPNLRFGLSIAMHGRRAVIGASGINTPEAAYVFDLNPVTGVWEETQVIPSPVATRIGFGAAVGIDADRIIVGAPADSGFTGAVHVYFDDPLLGYIPDGSFTGANSVPGSAFGGAVAIDGGLAVIGAQLHDGIPGVDSGAAYVFRNSGGAGWTQYQELIPSNAAQGDRFGFSVDLEGTVIAVGSPRSDTITADTGSVYAFDFDFGSVGWLELQQLTGCSETSFLAAGDWFGISVSLDGNWLAVGAWQDDTQASNAGAVCVFNGFPGSYSVQTKLTAMGGTAGDGLGYDVLVQGREVLAGAPQDDPNGADSGSAYVLGF